MKNKASGFVKNVMSVLSTLVKGKITGVKSKAQAMRVRLLVFSLLKSKKLSLGSITHKIQALLDRKHDDDEIEEETNESKAIVLYNASVTNKSNPNYAIDDHDDGGGAQASASADYFYYEDEDDDDKYPDLTHSLFDEEDGRMIDQSGSIIDIVKNSKENDGQDFKLEDEIDHVADLFIERFRRQMRLQKMESFKRIQAMIGRTA